MYKTKFKQTMRQIMIDWTNDYMNCSPRLRKLNSMLKETVEEKWKPTKRWSEYYCLDEHGDVCIISFNNDNIDNWNIKTGNCFPYTKEGKKQAEEYREKLIGLGEK